MFNFVKIKKISIKKKTTGFYKPSRPILEYRDSSQNRPRQTVPENGFIAIYI